MKRLLLILILCWLPLAAYAVEMNEPVEAPKLFPVEQVTSKAIGSGMWSDPAIWDVPPADGGMVLIPEGELVELDIDTPHLKWLDFEGMLHVNNGSRVTLWADTILGGMNSHLATPEDFDGQFTVVTGGSTPIDYTNDPYALSRGIILMGCIELNGRDVTTYSMLTEGVKAGDSVLTVQSAVTGWNAGDTVLLPGTSSTANEDDEVTVTAVDASRTIIGITPLRFDHLTVNREGFGRPIPACNIAPRSVHFKSENPLVCRAHMMIMRHMDPQMVQDFKRVSIFSMGRTDKGIPVTDPDGRGPMVPRPAGVILPAELGRMKTKLAEAGYVVGTPAYAEGMAIEVAALSVNIPNVTYGNPRGRYPMHYHRCGSDVDGRMSMLTDCVLVDSSDWGFVNHQSRVGCDRDVAYRVHGAHFVGESGDETGYFNDCVAIRSTKPPERCISGQSINLTGLSPLGDWAQNGHGFWTHMGGITISRCYAAGFTSHPLVLMGFGLRIGTDPPTYFQSKNLDPQYWPNIPQAGYGTNRKPVKEFDPKYVPQIVEDFVWVGCRTAASVWGTNDNGSDRIQIGRSVIRNSYGESDNGFAQGYLAGLDLENVRCVNQNPATLYKTFCFQHTGVNTYVTYKNCSAYGYGVGINCPTSGRGNSIKDCTFKCQNGLYGVFAARGDGGRTVDISGCTFLPNDSPTQKAYLGDTWLLPTALISGSNFPAFVSPYSGFDGWVKIDGKYAFAQEEDPNFLLANVKGITPLLRDLTTRGMWDTYRMTFWNRRIPDDATLMPGSTILTSTLPATALPKWVPNKSTGYNQFWWQRTSVPTGYVCQIKDAAGAMWQAAPVDLIDKTWNIVKAPLGSDGDERGVMIECDSTKIFPPNW